jgi:hypothetical protein
MTRESVIEGKAAIGLRPERHNTGSFSNLVG